MPLTPQCPRFVYGTAWKEGKSAGFTYQALTTGFRGIDTANQRKHYHEEGVGEGLRNFLGMGTTKREELFLQSKFTFARGQDHRKPYNESDPYATQVEHSFHSTLKNLHTDYLDSYLLHGPFRADGIGKEDLEVWGAMEKLKTAGKVHHIGISNVSTKQLRELCASVRIPPAFVQNRCYARMGWDRATREICTEAKIRYQGFSLLTANRAELQNALILDLTKKYNKTTAQIVFRFCQQVGMICLTGTTSTEHMKQDLDIEDFSLTDLEVEAMETLAT